MRVLDIITENQNPLSRLNTSSGAASSVNRLNHAPNEVSYIKQQLARHRLVTAYNPTTGQRTLGDMAWSGPIDQQWTPELDRAITAWKRSINLQVSGTERRPLDVNPNAPGIIRQDLQYLINTELGSDGLLDVAASGDLARAAPSNPGRLANMQYSETIPGTRQQVDADPTAPTLYNAVGWSAWYRIAAEIEESSRSRANRPWQELSAAERGDATLDRMDLAFNRNLTSQVSGRWLENVSAYSRNAVATYADGTTQPIDVTAALGQSPQAVDIFDYYSNMALKLWEKDRQTTAQARQTAADVAANPVSATTMDDATLRSMAAQLEEAFENRILALMPGGRSFSNDAEAVQAILGRLRTATDFDNLSTVYNEVSGGKVLHEQLYEELEKDDYMQIVVPRLLAIRRIAPRILHTNINFGEEDQISVEVNGRTYRIQQQTSSTGEPIIQGYDRPNDYDAIIIDSILRAGIEQSGGNLPDFDTPADEEAVAEVQLAFINTIQITYPEMVPFYVRAEPFDAASVDIGGARLREIIDDAARMGGNQAAIASFISREILNDRTWLIGDEDTEPAASIRFDERYTTEGLANRDFPVVSADEDVELNANEEEILENLKSTQETVVREAVDALLQSDDPAQMWENIYREAASQNLWLDEAANMGNGQRDVKEFLTGRDPGTNIIRLARSIGLAIAAPRVSAKMFYDAGRGRTFGTDEETIDALIAQIRNRYDYEMIDERYRQVGDGDSLIDDLASEQFQGLWGGGWYAALAAKIGDNRRLELIRAEIPRRVMDTLQDVERSPSNDTIQNLRRAIGREDLTEEQISLVVERLQDTVGDMEETAERLLLINLIGELTGDTESAQSTPEIPDYFSP
jgi:hypothetical protein